MSGSINCPRNIERPISQLDQIPDEELDRLRRRGITGLWLIGLWERSPASRRIKQMMGNPEAVASAYSLFDYRIAEDLGGDAALQDLKDRARQRGIRLASDMVPNHMGIDSRWVIEHPDWFIGLDRPPFPAYAFDGPDLSWDDRVGIQIEDRYYDRTDAAVVFKRFDKWTGDVTIHLSRQRRHELAVERHRPVGFPQARSARGGDPDDSARRPRTSRSSASTRP